ncbi:MAG: class I SAM-dependent methyltransferase [Candidatus Paceibacterota bacterium]
MSKPMYPKINIFKNYRRNLIDAQYSEDIPNITVKISLEYMLHALNISEKWDHCLDIGGGSGHYLTSFSQYFKKATLVEITNHEEHEKLKQNHSNIQIFQDLIENYNNREVADFILLADIYEHIPDIKAFVEKIAALQTYGGVVYIMTPNPLKCGPAPESAIYYKEKTYGHIKHYTTEEIVILMKKNGYELMFLTYEEGPVRSKVKRIIYGLSRRDKRFSKNFLYRWFKPVLFLLVTPLLKGLEILTYHSESKLRDNKYKTTTQNLAFKKIYGA